MKKSFKKIGLLLAAILICALVFAGCSSSGGDAAAGKWALGTVKAYDMEFSAKDMEMENFVIEFDGKGTCTINDGQTSASAQYELQDKTITIKDSGETLLTAELVDEKTMKVANFYNTGMEMTFTKQ